MAKPKRKANSQASKSRSRGKAAAAEIAGILLIALAVFLLISLVGYNPADPSLFSSAAAGRKIANFGGRAGAWLADLALQAFGLAAYLLPFILGFLGVRAVMVGGRKHLLAKAAVFATLSSSSVPCSTCSSRPSRSAGRRSPRAASSATP